MTFHIARSVAEYWRKLQEVSKRSILWIAWPTRGLVNARLRKLNPRLAVPCAGMALSPLLQKSFDPLCWVLALRLCDGGHHAGFGPVGDHSDDVEEEFLAFGKCVTFRGRRTRPTNSSRALNVYRNPPSAADSHIPTGHTPGKPLAEPMIAKLPPSREDSGMVAVGITEIEERPLRPEYTLSSTDRVDPEPADRGEAYHGVAG